MRGPQGPVRGGVTRCGRPPPLCRGRGRGKTSRLSTPSTSPTMAGGRLQLDASDDNDVPRDSISSLRVNKDSAMFFMKDETVPRRHFVRYYSGNRTVSMLVQLPAASSATNKEVAGSRTKTTRERDEGDGDEVRRISRVRRSFLKFRLPAASSRARFCWRFSALSATSRAPMPSPARKSIPRVRSRRGTAFCAASRPDRRPQSRLTTACRMRHRHSARCATCRRSLRPRGAAPSLPTPCRRPVRSGRPSRTRVCRGRSAPTSRG